MWTYKRAPVNVRADWTVYDGASIVGDVLQSDESVARLIAAAPELLAALSGFIEWAELMGTDERNSRLIAARAAIARATSED